jgi:hypothetical protein
MDPDLENEDEGSPGVAVGGLGAAPTAFSAADLASQMNAANAMVDKQIAAYRQMLESGANRLRERRVGPTAAERLFAISEAFSRPTRTGQFGERMGMLAQTLGAQSRAKREEELARDEMLEKYGMKGIELELGAGQKRAQLLAAMVAKQQATDVAKAKAMRPIFRGTQTLANGEIVAVYEDPASGELTKKPVGEGMQQLMPTDMLSGGKPVFRMGNKLVRADGAPVAEVDKPERKLSPTEIGLVDEKTKSVGAGKEALIALNRALELNPTALEGSLTGVRKSLGALFSSDDPAYVATEELDKTIIGSALTQMKTIFGGNPTEGERKILLDMQGASNQPRAVRERIFQNARAAVQRRLEADAQMLTDVRSGSFGRVQPTAPTPSKPGKPRILNWN